jgi:MerR family mercuric resistance operon transcriptional regulator
MSEQGLTIGKLAEAADVSVETVRFYQRKNLLDTPLKNGSIRRYDKSALRQLRFIRKAQEAGFTLKEIRELITLDAGQDHQRAYELANTRLNELDKKIAEMQRARDSLSKLAVTCACAGKSQPCAILAAFDD